MVESQEYQPPVALVGVSRGAVVRWAGGVAAFALLYGGMLLLLRHFDLTRAATVLAARAGVGGVLVFVGLMVLAVMTPLPDSPVALAGLALYGPLGGLVLGLRRALRRQTAPQMET